MKRLVRQFEHCLHRSGSFRNVFNVYSLLLWICNEIVMASMTLYIYFHMQGGIEE